MFDFYVRRSRSPQAAHDNKLNSLETLGRLRVPKKPQDRARRRPKALLTFPRPPVHTPPVHTPPVHAPPVHAPPVHARHPRQRPKALPKFSASSGRPRGRSSATTTSTTATEGCERLPKGWARKGRAQGSREANKTVLDEINSDKTLAYLRALEKPEDWPMSSTTSKLLKASGCSGPAQEQARRPQKPPRPGSNQDRYIFLKRFKRVKR
jgi:hypothetical protein